VTTPSFFSPEFRANPYPAYARLRDEQPVHRIEVPGGGGQHMWLVTRYDDVVAALKDPRLVKDWRRVMTIEQGAAMGMIDSPINRNMLSLDPPDHTRLRGLIQKAFTAPFVERLRGRIQQIADQLIDAAKARGEMDLIEAFAFPLPILVIAEMMGVPTPDHGRIREWSNALITASLRGKEAITELRPQIDTFVAYLRELAEARRKEPGADLVSALLVAEEQGQKLNEDELIGMLSILLIAGHETTVNLIGNGMLALLTHPEQLDWLKADPALIKTAVEEFLRYDGPVETSTHRFASEDLEIGGVQIRRGESLVVALAAADHDSGHFARPGDLDVARTDNKHLAFGHGIHYCVGAPLARIEGQIGIGTLLRRLPDLRLAVPPSELRWRPSVLIRGLVALPIAFTAQP
jgi:cytochrome P450